MVQMLRAVLLGLLAVSVTSSCSGGGDPQQVAPGAVAGKVLEASGNVAATRNGATRALAVGAEVFADDVIDTGNGSVVILLHHNNARWAVEGGQRTRVDESLAWKLARQDGPAKPVDHASSAAGREGERTAADTLATSGSAAPAVGNAAAESAPTSPPQAAAAMPAPAEKPKAPPPPPPPPRTRSSAGADEARADKAIAGGEGAGGGAAPEPKGAGKSAAPAGAPKEEKAVAPNAAPVAADVAPVSPPPEVRLRRLLEARRAELHHCVGTNKLKLTVRVKAGAPVIELHDGPASSSIQSCLESMVKKIPLAGITATASITLP